MQNKGLAIHEAAMESSTLPGPESSSTSRFTILTRGIVGRRTGQTLRGLALSSLGDGTSSTVSMKTGSPGTQFCTLSPAFSLCSSHSFESLISSSTWVIRLT